MRVFNWLWLDPLPATACVLPVARKEKNTIVVPEQIRGVVLYPSLMTPCVYQEDGEDPWLELLLVCASKKLSPDHVNRQLKVVAGLAAAKKYHAVPLFAGTAGNIEVEPVQPDGDQVLRTHSRFAGALHALRKNRLQGIGLNTYYRVRVHYSALLNAESADQPIRSAVEPEQEGEPGVLADKAVATALKRMHKRHGYQELPDHGLYALKLSADAVQVMPELDDSGRSKGAPTDKDEPIQAYHPVYFMDATEAPVLNLGHVTDVHVNGRVDILQKNPARVIPHPKAESVSGAVGALVQPTNCSLRSILTALADDPEAHGLLVGGVSDRSPAQRIRGARRAADDGGRVERGGPG